MTEVVTHERNNGSAGVTQVEVMVEGGGPESNTDTPSVTVNSANTSKTKVTGQKRKRYCFSVVQSRFLEVECMKGNLNRKEGRQKVADDFTKETKEHFDVDRIHTWFRNHKNKKNMSHLSRGEIVLDTNDDDILVYKG